MRDRIDISKFYGSVCQKTESPLRVTLGWLCTCQSYDMGFDFSSHFCLYGRCDAFLAAQSGIETFFPFLSIAKRILARSIVLAGIAPDFTILASCLRSVADKLISYFWIGIFVSC